MNLLYVVESGDYKYLVFDEMPDKISTKYGDDTIIGRIGGIFYDFLAVVTNYLPNIKQNHL